MYIHLDLHSEDPAIARASRKAALAYANNLPDRDAAHRLIEIVQQLNGHSAERVAGDISLSDLYFDGMKPQLTPAS